MFTTLHARIPVQLHHITLPASVKRKLKHVATTQPENQLHTRIAEIISHFLGHWELYQKHYQRLRHVFMGESNYIFTCQVTQKAVSCQAA